ncbi:MAG: flavodoxin domain-containing protein [Bacteroidetes bacterium]|nr:flavodoxin domain-containing protein [Bacteroidota bacterium]
MLAEHKQQLLTELVTGAGKEELIWINGYLAALINGAEVQQETVLQETAKKKITLVYGTETGNSKRVATELAAKAKKQQLQVKLASLDQYRLTDLTREENLFVVISTQGDGEPPVAAQKFYDHIHRNGFRLDQVKYSVLALGDSSYPLFCKTGEEVDAQLEKLGGSRLVPMRKCDVDYEQDAAAWFAEVLYSVQTAGTTIPAGVTLPASTITKSNKKIYNATVAGNQLLNDRGSDKAIYHIELLADEVDYLPGDSVGIVPENDTQLVEQIIKLSGTDPQQQVLHKNESFAIETVLKKKLAITHLHERVVKKYAAIVEQEIPEQKMDLAQLLQLYPLKHAAQFEEVVSILPAQSPRIYTIASSPTAHAGEIHLTVEQDQFTVNGKQQTGLCSGYLAGIQAEQPLDFFVQKNKRFRLPAADTDVLMIAKGTGIAAFRSFLAERDATGATGSNWLFFGEENFTTDFLYQTELQDWYQTGVLNGISLAFSKNQPQPFQVEDKLRAHGKDVYAWITKGAHIYVCGEKSPMSEAVEKVLQEVIAQYGHLSAQEAASFFEKMKEEGRYSKDVY